MGQSWSEDYGDQFFENYDMSQLMIDEAYIHFIKDDFSGVYQYIKHKECYKCPFISYGFSSKTTINTNYVMKLSDKFHSFLNDSDPNLYCELDDFGEFGVYNVTVDSTKNCTVDIVKEPQNIYLPLLTVFLIYAAVALCIFGICFAYKYFKKTKDENTFEDVPKKNRIKSLDTFRGISIVFMIFANYGSGQYEVLNHVPWNGLHLADLVFPWFMWIMGACIPISLSSSFKKGLKKQDIFKNILIRSIKLYCIGIFVTGGTVVETLRVCGVLQRFGICYLIVASICLLMKLDETGNNQNKLTDYFMDFKALRFCWPITIAMFIIHCLVIFLVHDENCPQGYFGPGGLHENGQYINCTGGALGYIDRQILGNHTFAESLPVEYYSAKLRSFDPEGLAGSLISAVHVFIGVHAGVILLTYEDTWKRLTRWILWALVTGIIGGGLCGFSKEDGPIPINKNLWSISFSLVTSCFAFIMLSFCYFLIDVKKWWSGKPFFFAGMNALLLYVGHETILQNFPLVWATTKNVNTHFIHTLENVWTAAAWVGVSYYLYRIKYFFTV